MRPKTSCSVPVKKLIHCSVLLQELRFLVTDAVSNAQPAESMHWRHTHNVNIIFKNKKHLKNVEPICHCEPPHAHSPDVASGTVARRLRIDVHDIDNDNDDNNDNDNAWQRGPLWLYGMGPTRNAWQSLAYSPLGAIVSSPSEYWWKKLIYWSSECLTALPHSEHWWTKRGNNYRLRPYNFFRLKLFLSFIVSEILLHIFQNLKRHVTVTTPKK